MNNENNQLKYHWFLFAYKCQTKDNKEAFGHGTTSKNDKNITQSKLTSIKNSIEKYDSSLVDIVITNISYLGFMTEKEFYDEPTN